MRDSPIRDFEKTVLGDADSEKESDCDGDDSGSLCPLCMNSFDSTDLSFDPCVCKYRVCLWCMHRLHTDRKGCPACRRPYDGGLLAAKPRQLEKLPPPKELTGAHFFKLQRTTPPADKEVKECKTDGGPVVVERCDSTEKLKQHPENPPPSTPAPKEADDPWGKGADPWAVAAAAAPRPAPVERAADRAAAAAPGTQGWWAAVAAEAKEAAAAPWLPPAQGKASRDLFDSAGLDKASLAAIGPSREEELEAWLERRRNTRPRSVGGLDARRRDSKSAGVSGSAASPPAPRGSSSAPSRAPRRAPWNTSDVTPTAQPSASSSGIKPISYAGAVLGVREAEVAARSSDTEVGGFDSPDILQGPPGSEGFFVLKTWRGPAVLEGFGPSAPSEMRDDLEAVLESVGPSAPSGMRDDSEAKPQARSMEPSPADSELSQVEEPLDPGLRIRARLALQEAMREADVRIVRRRLANAEAAGVSSVLITAARARVAELESRSRSSASAESHGSPAHKQHSVGDLW